MENKYNISEEIIKVMKEASIDCIQNTRDNILLNENCIRFDKSIQDENSYFPGIDSTNINIIDDKQLQSKIIKISNNNYMVPGKEDNIDTFIYYNVNNKTNIDIRYIRETGKILGILYPGLMMYSSYIYNSNYLKDKLGNKFSPMQEIYLLNDVEINNISDSKFDDPNDYDNLIGFKIKHNTSEKIMFLPNTDKPIIRLYDFGILQQNGFDTSVLSPIIFNKHKLYKINK